MPPLVTSTLQCPNGCSARGVCDLGTGVCECETTQHFIGCAPSDHDTRCWLATRRVVPCAISLGSKFVTGVEYGDETGGSAAFLG